MGIIEIKEMDETMKRIGTWRFDTDDRELSSKILHGLLQKYGIDEKKKEVDFWDMKVDW